MHNFRVTLSVDSLQDVDEYEIKEALKKAFRPINTVETKPTTNIDVVIHVCDVEQYS